MGAPDLLRALEEAGLRLSMQGEALKVRPRSALTDETRELIRSHKAELVELLARAKGPPEDPTSPSSVKAMQMLERDHALYRAVVTDATSDPETVAMAVAMRGVGVGEILIPRGKYDGLAVLAMLERYASKPAIH